MPDAIVKAVKVKDIKITDDRAREDLGDIDALAMSIHRLGLLHPIIVTKGLVLVAGRRRLEAHIRLELDTIDVRVKGKEELTELERKDIEFEEDVRRKDLTWQERVKAVKGLDDIKKRMMGASVKGHGGGWGQVQTADYLGVSVGSVSGDINLAAAMEEFPQLKKAKNKSSALRMLKDMRERKLIAQIASTTKVRADVKALTNGDGLVGAKGLKSGSVDMVFIDPPYGKDLRMKAEEDDVTPYEDNSYDVLNLIDLIFKESYRVLKDNTIMMVWFDIKHYEKLKEVARAAGFSVCDLPVVWCKGGGGGVLPNTSYFAMNTEYILHCQKGTRALNKKGQPNFFLEDRVPPKQKLHPTQKPSSLLRKIIEQCTLPGELVVDFFAGSASTIVAAFECGREAMGWELDADFYGRGIVNIQESIRETVKVQVEKEIIYGPKEAVGFDGLVPGTPEWGKAWRDNNKFQEAQEEMLEYVKRYREGRKEEESGGSESAVVGEDKEE